LVWMSFFAKDGYPGSVGRVILLPAQ
jgi:hypothetical protein